MSGLNVSVVIKYQVLENNLFSVKGWVDGSLKLQTELRIRDEKHLRGMLQHDLLHVTMGLGFKIENEKQIKSDGKLGLKDLAKVENAIKKLLKGQNIVLR